MEVNLYDSNFTQSICSCAYQTPKHVSYVRSKRWFDGVTLFTDEWINNPIVNEARSDYKIGWLREPFCLHPMTYERSLDYLNKFDFILTYHIPFLKLDPKYRFAPYGGTWLNDWQIKPKTKYISMLSGDKLSTQGHKIRREIADKYYNRLDMFGYKGVSVNYSQQTKIDSLASYRYSIITETCREDNLFTEWLLDAFLLGTIPIYWGCPNLAKFFNIEGVLPFSTIEELDDIIITLSNPKMAEYTYHFMGDAIKDNFNLAQEYAVTEDWLYRNYLKDMQ